MTIQEQLRTLVERHCTTIDTQVETVGRLLAESARAGFESVSLITEAQSITHQMKGTAGSMGFPDVGATAAALDESLKSLQKQPGPVSAAQLQASLDLLAALQRIAGETTPEMSTLYNADLSQLAR